MVECGRTLKLSFHTFVVEIIHCLDSSLWYLRLLIWNVWTPIAYPCKEIRCSRDILSILAYCYLPAQWLSGLHLVRLRPQSLLSSLLCYAAESHSRRLSLSQDNTEQGGHAKSLQSRNSRIERRRGGEHTLSSCWPSSTPPLLLSSWLHQITICLWERQCVHFINNRKLFLL